MTFINEAPNRFFIPGAETMGFIGSSIHGQFTQLYGQVELFSGTIVILRGTKPSYRQEHPIC